MPHQTDSKFEDLIKSSHVAITALRLADKVQGYMQYRKPTGGAQMLGFSRRKGTCIRQ